MGGIDVAVAVAAVVADGSAVWVGNNAVGANVSVSVGGTAVGRSVAISSVGVELGDGVAVSLGVDDGGGVGDGGGVQASCMHATVKARIKNGRCRTVIDIAGQKPQEA